MKAKLIFDFDKPEDRDDYKRCNQSLSMALAIWEYDQYLREQYKYQGVEDAYELRDKFREILTENGIDIDNIIQ
jgi:hypothetical protein